MMLIRKTSDIPKTGYSSKKGFLDKVRDSDAARVVLERVER